MKLCAMVERQTRMRTVGSGTLVRIAWVGGAALALGGCSRIEVKLGRRVLLAKIPVASMEASLSKGPGIAPGEKSPLVVALTEPNGTVLMTEGQGKGKVLWNDLVVTASVVTVNKKGVLSLPHDPRKSDGKTGHVVITAPSQPNLRAELDIPLRYDYAFSADFSGSSGSGGLNGSDGSDGASGSTGSFDPEHPSAGGDGTNGGNGGDGQDGSRGGDGPAVEVRVALRAGGRPMIEVSVAAKGYKERFFLVDPQGGSLTVSAEGGSGGSGGKGGRAGRGGSGGAGMPSGRSGSDGSSGRDGSSGWAGSAGKITVIYDPQVTPYLAAIHGWRGGPQPVFMEEPVAPLW